MNHIKIINEAIKESGWQDLITSDMGTMVPNPRNKYMISEFLKIYSHKHVWQSRFQAFMKEEPEQNQPCQCDTWAVFMGRLLIYGRNLHYIATEYHNGSPPGLKASFKDSEKKDNEKPVTESQSSSQAETKISDSKNNKSQAQQSKKKDKQEKPSYVCYGCGRKGHLRTQCKFAKHPDFNKSKDNWEDSVSGKAWLAHPSSEHYPKSCRRQLTFQYNRF